MHVILAHDQDGPGSTKAYGPFESQQEAVVVVPRAGAAAGPRWAAMEVVEVQALSQKSDANADIRPLPTTGERVREHARRLLAEGEHLGYDQEADGVLGEAIDSFVAPLEDFDLKEVEEFQRDAFLRAVADGRVVIPGS